MTEHQFNLALFYMLNRDKGLTFEEMFDIIFDSGHHLENARFLNAVYPAEDDFGKHARIICSRCKDSEIIQLYLKELSYESNPILSSVDMFPGQNVEQRMQILRKLHNIKGYFKHPLDRRRGWYKLKLGSTAFARIEANGWRVAYISIVEEYIARICVELPSKKLEATIWFDNGDVLLKCIATNKSIKNSLIDLTNKLHNFECTITDVIEDRSWKVLIEK